jgi:hypothetical protein
MITRGLTKSGSLISSGIRGAKEKTGLVKVFLGRLRGERQRSFLHRLRVLVFGAGSNWCREGVQCAWRRYVLGAWLSCIIIFFGSLALMIKGVDQWSNERALRYQAKKCGWLIVRDFENDQRERTEVAILGRAGPLYAGLPAGTTLEEACRIKATAGDVDAQHYLAVIEQQRMDDAMFPARKSLLI